MRAVLISIVGMVSLCSLAFGGAASRPNVVYILADDLGYGDLSCFNRESKIRTPNLDAIAAQGMIFTDAHSGSSVCTPTRYGIITGRYSWRSRLKRGVLGGASPHLIDPERYTVADLLKGQGYHTAMIGKWHLGWDFQFKPVENAKGKDGRAQQQEIDYSKRVSNGPDVLGFDHYYGHCGSLDMAPYVYVENGRVTAAPDRITENRDSKGFWRKGPTGSDFRHIDVLPNFINRACKYIDSRAPSGQPFFLYLPLPSPHTPILPIERFQGKSGTNEYGDFVQQVDWHVGQVMEALRRNGCAENTLLIFTSDNGCSPRADFQELAALGHRPSYRYRGHKADIYEGGHRVPFIAHWPKGIKAASQSAATICLVDLMATVAEITEGRVPPNAAEDSVSFLAALQGRAAHVRDATIHHSINGSFAIRKGDWKLVLCPGSGGWSHPKPAAAKEMDLPPVQLFNLKSDPAEENNVFGAHPEILKELYTLLQNQVEAGRSTAGPRLQNEGDTPFERPGFDAIRAELQL